MAITIAPGRFRSTIRAAANTGSADRIRILIDHGAEVSCQDDDGQTPLHQAAFLGHSEAVKELLGHGCPVNIQDKHGSTALMLAAGSGSAEVVKELLDGGSLIDIEDRKGMTVLVTAAAYGHVTIVKLLISRGAATSESGASLHTPLHAAAVNNCLAAVKVLVAHGADVDARDAVGMTPLAYAIRADQVLVARYLIQVGAQTELSLLDGRTLLHVTAEHLSHKAASMLLKQGSDVNALTPVNDWQGSRTPLHLAIDHRNIMHSDREISTLPPTKIEDIHRTFLDTISVLLCHGADPNLEIQGKVTAVSLAIRQGQCAAADMIIRGGGDVKTCATGLPPTHQAFRSRSSKMMKLVLDHGADVNAHNEEEQTVLQAIVESEGAKWGLPSSLVALLLRYGAETLGSQRESEFQHIRDDMKMQKFRDKFYDKEGFDLDQPLYDLSNTPYDNLIKRDYLPPGDLILVMVPGLPDLPDLEDLNIDEDEDERSEPGMPHQIYN